MSLKLVTAMLVAVTITSSPALACMGSTVIFADNFQPANPGWNVYLQGTPDQGAMTFSGGYAQLTPLPGAFTFADYEGSFINSADACVDVMSPTVADPTQASAGIMFGRTDNADAFDFYVFAVREDGQAAVLQYQLQAAKWLSLVSWSAAPGLKQGGNVTNTLRVTWSGTGGTAYINGQQFATFAIPVFQGTTFGIWCEGDPGVNPTAGATYQFTNVKVTNAP